MRVQPGDARLQGRGVATGIAADGKVEVYLAQGGTAIRTPLASATRRMTIAEHKALVNDIRTAVREVYGINVERVYIAGSSTGIPFTDGTGTVRTFDRAGPMTSDYDGALVSPELFEKAKAEGGRRVVRGKTTGLRTPPDPLPALRERMKQIETKYGRHVAAMVYASQAEFDKRMRLQEFTVGKNIMGEPTNHTVVEATSAEMLGALIEVEQLKRLQQGRTAEQARILIEQAKAGEASAQETVRKARVEATKAVQQRYSGLNPVDAATLANELKALESPQRFAGPRTGPRGPPQPLSVAASAVESRFAALREVAAAGVLARGDAGLASRVASAKLEVVASNDLLLEVVAAKNTVRVSTGLLNAVERAPLVAGESRGAFRQKALGLLFGHELAHLGGIKGEAVADAEAVKTLERAGTKLVPGDARRVVELFKTGRPVADALYALRDLVRYGPNRAARIEATARGEVDRLKPFRRADGTVDWKKYSASKALQHGAGVSHFALALFLKELAVVVRTGDRLRIDEFFEHLATTDFFVTYGLFSVGAHAGNVAYSRYLAKHIKPKFVSGVLRTNIVLATGMLLPDLVRGHFDGKVFAINVVSLGLSATAVQGRLAALKWVTNLKRARLAGRLRNATAGIKRLARAGGWLYTAAETAVILYFGDEIAQAIHRYLDERTARAAVADATRDLLDASAAEDDAAFAQALEAYEGAQVSWRDHLFKPLSAAEALYQSRLVGLARKAKLLADQRDATLAQLGKHAALRDSIERRYGSLAAYAARLEATDKKELEASLGEVMQVYDASRTKHLTAVYTRDRRPSPYLTAWNARSARYESGTKLSENRAQSYDDERRALTLLHGAVAGDPEKTKLVAEALARNQAMKAADLALFQGKPVNGNADGAVGALERQ